MRVLVWMGPVDLEKGTAMGIEVDLPKTHLAIVSAPSGYLMCGALDVALLDERLAERRIVAGRAVGVKTVKDLLQAPLEKVTDAARSLGLKEGMTGREAMNLLLSLPSVGGE